MFNLLLIVIVGRHGYIDDKQLLFLNINVKLYKELARVYIVVGSCG